MAKRYVEKDGKVYEEEYLSDLDFLERVVAMVIIAVVGGFWIWLSL